MKAVNLIPSDQRRGAGGIAGRSGGIVYVVVGGLTVVVALGVVYASSVKTVADREGRLAQVTDEANAVAAQSAALTPYVQVAQLRQGAVSGVVGLAEQRFDWADAMRQLALALPSDVTLTSLTASATSGVPAPSAPGAPSSSTSTGTGAAVSLSGCASNPGRVAAVVTALEQVPGVTQVSLSSTTKDGKVPNDGKPAPRSVAASRAGSCPLADFAISLSYGSSYTVPNVKLAASSPSSAQTLSSSIQPGSNESARAGR